MKKWKTVGSGVFGCVLTMVLSGICPAWAGDGSKIYVIRHGETMGNVTGDYSEENQCTFSPKGLEQVASVPEVLAPYTFDYIAVSPTWRTRQTVLPYLKAFERKGVIWPEFEEGGCDLRGLPAPAAVIPPGEKIILTENDLPYFELRDSDSEYRYAPTSNPESLAILQQGIRKLTEQFAGTGKSVLLVSHSCTGSRLIELLLGIEPRGRFAPQNTAVTLLEEGPDGVYRMVLYNNKPFRQAYRWQVRGQDVSDIGDGSLDLVLCGDFFAPVPESGYRLLWKVCNAAGTSVRDGEERFSAAENTESEIYALQIPIDAFKPGDDMTLESFLYDGDTLLREWKQTVRIPDTLNLAGVWSIKQGDNPKRAEIMYEDRSWDSTQVPGAWEKDALPGYDGIAWYRYRFAVPAACAELWGDQPLALLIGAIDDADVTYLDGQEIGASGHFPPEKESAYNTRRIYPIPSTMTAESEHLLAVQVSDWMGDGGICKGPVLIGPEKSLRSLNVE